MFDSYNKWALLLISLLVLPVANANAPSSYEGQSGNILFILLIAMPFFSILFSLILAFYALSIRNEHGKIPGSLKFIVVAFFLHIGLAIVLLKFKSWVAVNLGFPLIPSMLVLTNILLVLLIAKLVHLKKSKDIFVIFLVLFFVFVSVSVFLTAIATS